MHVCMKCHGDHNPLGKGSHQEPFFCEVAAAAATAATTAQPVLREMLRDLLRSTFMYSQATG